MKKLNDTDYNALNYILYNQKTTRTDLAKFLKISQPAVNKLIKKLDSFNLLTYKESNDNRIKNYISLNNNYKKIIGVYVCINFLEICVSDLTGNILETFSYPINSNFIQKEKTKNIIIKKVKNTINKYKKENIIGIGFSIQSDIDSNNGILLSSNLFENDNVRIEDFFFDIFGINCIFENNIHSMLYAIDIFQNIKNDKLLYYKKNNIQGVSFMIDNQIYKGANYKMSNFKFLSNEEISKYINLLDIDFVILNTDENTKKEMIGILKCNNIMNNSINDLEKLSSISLILKNLFKNKKLI